LKWTGQTTKPYPLLVALTLAFVSQVSAQQWAQLMPTGSLPSVRGSHSAVFNTTSNRMIVYSGQNGTLTPLGDVWVLANADGTGGTPNWTQLNPTGGPPSARVYNGAVYDAVNNRMVIFAGDPNIGFCFGAVNDVWVLTNADGTGGTPNWTQLSPTGGPPELRQSPTAVYDSATNRMVVFGGVVNSCGPLSNDVWVLTNANGLGGTPVWSHLAPVGGPPAPRHFHSSVYDSANNRMVVFGGQTNTGLLANDVWVLENANGLGGTPAWTQLIPTGVPPSPRDQHTAVYDPASNRMVVFGGAIAAGGDANDVWVLENANGLGGTPAWTLLIPTSVPPSPREKHTAVFNTATNRMVVFAGFTQTTSSYLNDVWVLTDANGVPPAPACLANGGGQYLNNGEKHSFGGNAESVGGVASGHFNDVDHATGQKIDGDVIGATCVSANSMKFEVQTKDGCFYLVTYTDNGEPGAGQDTIEISGEVGKDSNPAACPNGTAGPRTLAAGNIQVQ